MYLFVDYEARSRHPIAEVGADRWSDEAEILMLGYKRGGEPAAVADCLKDVRCWDDEIVSWGAFDRILAQKRERITLPWIDASALALYCGLPRSLNGFCESIGIKAKKDPRGTRLINKYCRAQPDGTFREMTPEDRTAFEEYCLVDVELLAEAWRFLGPIYPEWRRYQETNYWTTEVMNRRGVPIDRAAVKEAIRQIEQQERALEEEFRALTGLAPTQTEKVRELLELPDIQRATLQSAKFSDPVKQRAAEIRLAISNATVKKLRPMLDRTTDEDPRARGCFTNNGAHTGRGSSQGIQFQNMKRAKIVPEYFELLHSGVRSPDPLADAQKNIRGFVCADPRRDFQLVVADYSQIEVRVLAWLLNDPAMLALFVGTEDPYKAFASLAFGVAYEEVTEEQRQYGKVVVLACGYGVGADGLARQAVGYGLHLKPRESWRLVDRYHALFPAVRETFKQLDKWVPRVVWGEVDEYEIARCAWKRNKVGSLLTCTLPSGRKVRYMKPSTYDGLSYQGRIGATTVRKKLWGGHIVENLCQAIATDIKLDAMHAFRDHGLVAEVHDEIILEVPRLDAEQTLEKLIEKMRTPPLWMIDAPAKLLDAKGWIGQRYSK